MIQQVTISKAWALTGIVVIIWLSLAIAPVASALAPIPPPDPEPGGFGIEATKTQDPPTRGATITTPNNGASFSNSPISVNGICPAGLLVQLYNNGVMVGSVMCNSGSFSIEVSLFAGENDLYALVFDDLGQAGPRSNTVTVNYTDTNFTAFGELITLTSVYGRLAAPTGSVLTWPLQLSGGTGPYAFSIDWGDGSEPQLLSQSLAGVVNIRHTYKQAGIYTVNIRVTDTNGVSAFLQVVAVSSGQVDPNAQTEEVEGEVRERVVVLWIPAVIAMLLLLPTYWLGRRSQLVTLRNRMLKERDAYNNTPDN